MAGWIKMLLGTEDTSRPRWYCVRWGLNSSTERGTSGTTYSGAASPTWSMSIVWATAKRL